MKKLFLLAALAICMFATAQVPTNTTTPAVKPSTADIKFDKTKHDYGTIKYESDGNCEFKYTNTGKEPLIINTCQQSCGCTTPSCPKEPLLPGKSNTIKVHYATNRPGPFNKTVTIKSNAKSGEVVLTITGIVDPKPVDEPFPTDKKPNNGTPLEKTN